MNVREEIVALARNKFGLKEGEKFQFANQKSKDNVYWFTNRTLYKETFIEKENTTQVGPSHVSFNWIIDEKCKIKKLNPKTDVPGETAKEVSR